MTKFKDLDIKSKIVFTTMLTVLASCGVISVLSLYDHASLMTRLADARNLTTQMRDAQPPAGLTWALVKHGCLITALVVLARTIAGKIALGIVKPISQTITGLTRNSQEVFDAAAQVAEASREIACGASEQAVSLQETSSGLENMAATTQQNAASAREASHVASSTWQEARGSRKFMERMMEAIEKIKRSSERTAKILQSIDDIAFQTNLLSLNAAVEAARAGEAGRGFAVVAEEVRNLARRSAEAARSTSALIHESQKNLEDGVAASREVDEVMLNIGERLQGVTRLVDQVSQASGEQALGITEITGTVTRLGDVTQRNAANSREGSSVGEALFVQAKELGRLVEDLTRIVGVEEGLMRARDEVHVE